MNFFFGSEEKDTKMGKWDGIYRMETTTNMDLFMTEIGKMEYVI